MAEKPLSRRQLLRSAGAGGLALLLPASARAQAFSSRAVKPAENVVLRWNDALLQGVRNSKLGPPMVSRALAIAHTSIFDAWAAYDGTAVGTRLGGALRRPASVHDPDRWQPLRYLDGSGTLVMPTFVGAQWQRVAPFAMASNAELRSPTGPAAFATDAYREQCQQLIDLSAGLTDEEKMIAEYCADGPRSELPPGHWNLRARQVS